MEHDIDSGNTYYARQAGFEPPLDGWEKTQELRSGKYVGYDHQFEMPGTAADTLVVSFPIHPDWFL